MPSLSGPAVRIFIFFALFCVIAAFPSILAAEEPEVIRFADAPFPPYVMGEEGEHGAAGISVDIALKVCDQLGCRATIDLLPWKRVLKRLESGNSDAVLTLIRSPLRETFLLFTVPFIESGECIYYNGKQYNNFDWTDYRDLQGYTIGLVSGYVYGEKLEEAIAFFDLDVDYANTPEQNLRKLAAGRVDLVIEEEKVADYYIRSNQNWSNELKKHPRYVTRYSYHMAFSRSSVSVSFVERYNSELSRLVANGTIQAIIDAYTE